MAPILYMVPPSPPVRAVQITAKALGLEFEEKPVNIFVGEQLTPEFLKINPQHTVPTLVEDDGFTIWDSPAINAYLVTRYGKDDALYPKDLRKKAVVDQRLHFDTGVAFRALAAIMSAALYHGKDKIIDEDRENINRVYAFLEAFLDDGKKWIAGDTKTIADYNLFTTTTALDTIVQFDKHKYPKVAAWIKKLDALPEVEACKKGLEYFKALVETKFFIPI